MSVASLTSIAPDLCGGALWSLAFQGSAAQNPIIGFLPLILIFGIFWFLVVLPMRKRQKALQRVIENLKKGDRVLTTGGIYGEVAAIDGPNLVLKIADNVRVRVARSAVSGLEGEAEKGDKT